MRFIVKEDHTDPLKTGNPIKIAFKITKDAIENANMDIPQIDHVVKAMANKPHQLGKNHFKEDYFFEISYTENIKKNERKDVLDKEMIRMVLAHYNYQMNRPSDILEAILGVSKRIDRVIHQEGKAAEPMIAEMVQRTFEESPLLYDANKDYNLITDVSLTGGCTHEENMLIEQGRYAVAIASCVYINKNREHKYYLKVFDFMNKQYDYLPLPYVCKIDYTLDLDNMGTSESDMDFVYNDLRELMTGIYGVNFELLPTFSWARFWSDYFLPVSNYASYCYDIYLDVMERANCHVRKEKITKYVGEKKIKQGKTFRFKKLYRDEEVYVLPSIPPLKLRTMSLIKSVRER